MTDTAPKMRAQQSQRPDDAAEHVDCPAHCGELVDTPHGRAPYFCMSCAAAIAEQRALHDDLAAVAGELTRQRDELLAALAVDIGVACNQYERYCWHSEVTATIAADGLRRLLRYRDILEPPSGEDKQNGNQI